MCIISLGITAHKLAQLPDQNNQGLNIIPLLKSVNQMLNKPNPRHPTNDSPIIKLSQSNVLLSRFVIIVTIDEYDVVRANVIVLF